ncbi:MAG TPA: Uma2 family endonuclease [Bryobacteraceae bacterium]|nr:Uma2 family endonuclease [Bryobacteraceae bacterium]
MSAATQLSLEEFLNLPDAPGKLELLDGELLTLPPAKFSHMEMVKRFQSLLEAAVGRSRVWFEMGYQLGRHWLQPDLSVSWPDQRLENDWFQGAPMLAVEIVSPGNRAEEIERKIAVYLEEGAAEIWIVYPKTRSMTVVQKEKTLRSHGDYHCELIGVTVKADDLKPASN